MVRICSWQSEARTDQEEPRANVQMCKCAAACKCATPLHTLFRRAGALCTVLYSTAQRRITAPHCAVLGYATFYVVSYTTSTLEVFDELLLYTLYCIRRAPLKSSTSFCFILYTVYDEHP